jgi:pyruvate,water dikinase
MPDPLSPLFESLGLPAIEHGIDLMSQDLFNMPATVLSGFMQTINGYAYQKVSFSGRQWWWLLTRLLPAIPRMMREGVPYWRDVAHPRYVATVSKWRDRDLAQCSSEKLWAGVRALMAVFGHHLASLMASTMGPTAGSEALFTRVYERMIRQEGDPTAPTFLMGFDSIPIRAEKALYDLAQWCQEHEALASYLATAPTDEVLAQLDDGQTPDEVPSDDWDALRAQFRQHLADYGHQIYTMDLAKPLPADEPTPILETLKMFVAGRGKDPHERQQAYVERREQAVQAIQPRLRGLKRWAFDKLLNWAQSQAPLREDGLAELGLAYPMLRRMLRELGQRLVQAGAIGQPDDIYWLDQAEVETALDQGDSPKDLTGRVNERQQLWKARKQATPPPQLPPGKKLLGMDMESMLAVGETDQTGGIIKGAATSPGQVTATARVLHGPEDMDQMRPGDILVASITTPAWTPLFAMAAGVVTDIGGALSHSSIVAREYGIPAVLGTGIATKRIRSGQTITVDGTTGTVTLHE